MTHREILERLILFLDRDLPEKEMQHIREHLSTCPACTKEYDALASLWCPEVRPEKMKPSPFLWTRLQAQIEEYERTPEVVWGVEALFRAIRGRPLPVLAVLGAIVAGVYLGSPQEQQPYETASSVSSQTPAIDELGLEQFDVIPPGSFGSAFVKVTQTDLKSQQRPTPKN